MRRSLPILLGMLLTCLQLLAQNRVITGKVTDEKGNPLPDVSVQVKGTSSGTLSKQDGTYSLTINQNARTLVFTSVGMTPQEVSIGSNSQVDAQLVPNANELTEVVVQVPYGTVKKTAFTGSEATITAKTLVKQQVVSVTNAIEGLVPGVIATNGGGAPGNNAAGLLIRGVGSVSAAQAPLFVLNGIPYDGSISSIPIDDIESVTVLKDAAAAALYGSRAANGVIMIITKKGRRGRNIVTANVREGFLSRGIPEYDEVGPKDYYELFWESFRNSYLYGPNQANYNPTTAGQAASNILTTTSGLVYNAYNVPGNTLVDPATGKINPSAKLLYNESWANALYRTAQRTNANIGISGGSDRTDYYISANYLDEQGVLRFSGYKRYNLRLNINTQATDWLNVGVNLDGSSERRNDLLSGGTATSNPFYYSREMGPIYPVYQHDPTTGAYVIDPTTGKPALDWGTPAQMGTRPYAGNSNLLGSLALDDRSRYIFNGNANTYAEIKFLRSFSFKTTVGVNYFANVATSYQNNQFGDAAPSPGQANGGRSTKTDDRQLSITANEVLTWNKSFGEHSIRVLAGHENYKYQYNYLSANKSGFQFPGQSELDNGTTSFSPASSYQIDHRIESYFAGINYDYRQKYLLSASYRTDGSSRFRDSVRWGSFYSAGAGYRISQEEFLKGVSWINELKLKVSYGEQGNENIGLYYPYRLYYYANGDGTYQAPQRPASPNIQWETNKTLNAGFDFVILKNRLQGTIEYFNRVSDNLLFDVPLPPSTGNQSVYKNIGTMKNYGVELQLGYNAIRAKNFDWRIDLNLTHFTNKITKLPPGSASVNGIITGTKKLFVGHGIFDFWLPQFAGVDAANGDALYYKDVLDLNGKPTGQKVLTNSYSQATFYFHGSAIPKISGGLTNSFRYKNFDLSFLLTFAYGGLFYDVNYASIMHRGSPGIAWSTDILNRWQKPGDVTDVPRLQVAISGQEGASTRWLVDGSFINVKNVTLSYTIPGNIASRLHLGALQVYGNIDNAYLFTAKKGLDPQRSFAGTADATYPPYRTITFGLNVTLQ